MTNTSTDLESLSQRVMELEVFKHFLKENVIDTSLLEAIRNRKQSDDEKQQQRFEEIEIQQYEKLK